VKFKVILADSPWKYGNPNTGGSLKSGASAKYDTMSLKELCSLPVKKLADDNSVLFLWVTTPLKYEIAQSGLVEKWGYSYKTTIYWEKIGTLGLGFNFRNRVEECWMCTRGKVTPFRTSFSNVIEECVEELSNEVVKEKPMGHSKKPEGFFKLVEPSLEKFDLNPRLEMFARTIRPGWRAIGNEITGNDIRIDLKKLIKE
jgi:site-specific DNA-methyltransferase (adenine-specific)